MKRVLGVSLAVLTLATVPMFAQDSDGGFFAAANLGYDVIGGGFAGGGSVGMEFSDFEAGLIAMYGNGETNYDDDEYEGTWDWELFLIGLRLNWVYRDLFPDPNLFPIVGAGFFYMNYAYTDSYTSDLYADGEESDDVGAGGSLFSLGVGYAFTEEFDARLEVPVLVFFGDFGRIAVAIPVLVGVGVHF